MTDTCPRCNQPLIEQPATTGFLCGGPAGGGRIQFPPGPPRCPDPVCRAAQQAERDAAALARAVEAGVIDP